MLIAVTGATGFLGSHLLPQLRAAGYPLRVLVRRPTDVASTDAVQPVVGDLEQPETCSALLDGCSVLIHLAGLVSRDPADGPQMYALNVEATRRLLRATIAAGVKRVVLASSSGTIAISKTARLATEADDYPLALVANWPYYLSKIYQEKLSLELCAQAKVELVCLNPSLLLGPGDLRFSSTSDVWRFLQGQIPAMPSGGISFVDVRDAAAAFVQAVERGRPGERYLLGAVNWSFEEFFGRLSRLSGVPPPRFRVPSTVKIWGAEALQRLAQWRGVEPGLDRSSVEMGEHFFFFDSGKAETELGFAPRDPQETLRETLRDLQARQREGDGTGLHLPPWRTKTVSAIDLSQV